MKCTLLLYRTEAIEVFNNRPFLKIRLNIPLGQFDRKIIEEKAGRDLAKLKMLPLQVANQTSEIETIPYEDLWVLALDSLDQTSKDSRSANFKGLMPGKSVCSQLR